MKTVDLLLINPPVSLKERYDPVELEAARIRAELCKVLFERYAREYSLSLGDCTSDEMIDPPTGLLILSSIAKGDGFDVGLIDLNAIQASRGRALTDGEIEHELRGFEPGAIGITSFTHNQHEAMRALRIAKDRFPNSMTVYGGIHATFTDLDVLKAYGFVDCIVRGEAETIISPLLRAIKGSGPSKERLRAIDGLTFRLEMGGTGAHLLVRNPDNMAKPDLNEIPLPDYGLLDKERYRASPFFHVFGQRGCPHDCTFCANVSFFGRSSVRRKRPDRVIEEIKLIQSLFGNKVFLINDDTFTSHKKYAMELCHALEQERLGTCYQVQSRVDRIDDELLKAMGKARVVYMWLGCESADPSVLRMMNKGISPGQIEDACIKIKDHHMDVGGYWLVGFPGETFDSIQRTRAMIISLIERDLMDVYEQSIFVPYPGTAVFDHPSKFNVSILTHDFIRYREDGLPVVGLPGLTPEDIYEEWLRTTRMANEILDRKLKAHDLGPIAT